MLGVLFGGAGSMLSGASLLKMGFMAASAVGMYIFGGKKEQGEVARLDDLKVSSSAYGRGIAIVYGTMRVTGNMFWATDFEEVLTYIGPKQGKGGSDKKGEKKGTPYYIYFANFAMCLCEGPVEELLRVWADSNLIYDKHNPKNSELVGPGFSQAGGGGKTGLGGGKKKGNDGGDSGRFSFRFYPGTETQQPDHFMVQKQGADLVPAHRGMSYLFFERFKLEDFGNRIPTITAEVTVKKKQNIINTVLENMDGSDDMFVALGSSFWADADRYIIYSVERGPNPWDETDWIIRSFDISQQKETRRISFREINEAHAGQIVGVRPFGTGGDVEWKLHEIIGLAGNGDIVARLHSAGTNNAPVSFLDPHTFMEKAIFGDVYRSPIGGLSNTPTSIVAAQKAFPATYIWMTVDVIEGPKTEVRPCTIINSLGLNFYIFGQDHEPLSYFKIDGLGYTTDNLIQATDPDIFGGEFYMISNHRGFSSEIRRVKWEVNKILSGDYPYVPPILPMDPQVEIIRTSNDRFVYFHSGQWVAGIDKYCWFEAMFTDDFETEGSYYSIYDAERNEIIAREKVSNDWANGPFLGNTNKTQALPVNTSREMKWIQYGKVWEVDFYQKTVKSYSLGKQDEGDVGSWTSNFQLYWPTRGATVRWIEDPNDEQRKMGMTLLDRNDQTAVTVHTIASDLADRVGIPPLRVNLTELDEHQIMGYIIENPTSARKVIEELAQVFMFDVAEIDYQLKFVSRGKDPVVTVPQRDLAVVDDETADYYIESRIQEIELPQTVIVNYINPDKDYQVSSQHYRRPRSPMPVMHTRDKLELQLRMAMHADTAKQMAHKVTMAVWSERTNYELMLSWKYLPYDPTDVMKFQMDDGLDFTTRMMKMDLGANFSIEAVGVAQVPASYRSDAIGTDPGGVISEPKPWPPKTQALALDIPYLEDADDVGSSVFLHYWGSGPLGPGLTGAIVQHKVDGYEWDHTGLVHQGLVWGSVRGVVPPPPWGPWVTDDVNSIELLPAYELGDSYSFESIPESEWPSDKNCVVINDEIIYFRDVVVGPLGQVVISHLIRGARGTENAAYEHGPREKFIVNTPGLRTNTVDFLFLNKVMKFRSFSKFTLTPAEIAAKMMTGASHKPWGPNRFRIEEKGGGDYEVAWYRRTRLNGSMKDGTGIVPLSEESESYELYILPQAYDPDVFDPADETTYTRMYTDLTSPKITYTAAEQLEDGWTPDQPLHVVAYQISAQVGRGFPGHATLYNSILI